MNLSNVITLLIETTVIAVSVAVPTGVLLVVTVLLVAVAIVTYRRSLKVELPQG